MRLQALLLPATLFATAAPAPEVAWARWTAPGTWPAEGDPAAPPPSRESWERLRGREALGALLAQGREAEARRWMQRWADVGGWRGALEEASGLAREAGRPVLDNRWGRLAVRGRRQEDLGWDQVARKARQFRVARFAIAGLALGALVLVGLASRRRRGVGAP